MAQLPAMHSMLIDKLHDRLSEVLSFKDKLASKRASRSHSDDGLCNLIRNMSTILPRQLVAMAGNVAKSIKRSDDAQAVVAADILVLLLAPANQQQANEVATIVNAMVAAAASNMPALRLKVANVLPSVISACERHDDREKCIKALESRLSDSDASVRTAAVRAVGEHALGTSAKRRVALLRKLLERTKDVAETVRSMVRCFCPPRPVYM